jgi:twitching motility protein PilT
VNISRVLRGVSISFRTIPTSLPTQEEILLPEHLLKLTHVEKGIILLTGPTGSGKSTTMAVMLDYINTVMKRHIITLEDPIEFVYQNKKSLIHQRELGKHFDTFETGIRSILREDPDVIVVGEMRDLATMEAAITLAETGHLVFSTLHTNDTVQTIERILQSFPPEKQNQIRMQFGLTMRAIISQILLPKKEKNGRIVAREIMINNDSVRNLIIR